MEEEQKSQRMSSRLHEEAHALAQADRHLPASVRDQVFDADEAEAAHFRQVLYAFQKYGVSSLPRIGKAEHVRFHDLRDWHLSAQAAGSSSHFHSSCVHAHVNVCLCVCGMRWVCVCVIDLCQS
jgi:hypothetical protein